MTQVPFIKIDWCENLWLLWILHPFCLHQLWPKASVYVCVNSTMGWMYKSNIKSKPPSSFLWAWPWPHYVSCVHFSVCCGEFCLPLCFGVSVPATVCWDWAGYPVYNMANKRAPNTLFSLICVVTTDVWTKRNREGREGNIEWCLKDHLRLFLHAEISSCKDEFTCRKVTQTDVCEVCPRLSLFPPLSYSSTVEAQVSAWCCWGCYILVFSLERLSYRRLEAKPLMWQRYTDHLHLRSPAVCLSECVSVCAVNFSTDLLEGLAEDPGR